MLDLNLIRADADAVKAAVRNRQMAELDPVVDEVLALDARRRELLKEVETLKADRNAASKAISRLKDAAEREARIAEQKGLGDLIAGLDDRLRGIDEALQAQLNTLPNLPDPRTPIGQSEDDNVLLRAVGTPRQFDFDPQPHWDLGPRLGLIDFERGAKLTGSRFYVLTGAGARLQRALIAWMLDLHTRGQGYTEVYTPFLVRENILYGAGQLPKFRENLYHDAEEDLWLVPTAEVPITGLHKDEILEPGALPKRYTGYTPCFRREKMAAGRDVRGIKRGHQFDKVEMYVFCRPEQSDDALERMREHAEATCAGLGLPYRVKQLCTADLGFSARMTYDLEVWAPGCGEWLEVSSVSNCGDFQARRANIRFRRETGARPEFVHTLNGSGLGLPRILIAVLENYQQADGTVVVPEVLRPWMGGLDRLEPEA
ncbi:MAG: serine--tRNA ligase [Anaerolineales bacterium]|nr:serine--tRNA ligase [Anaerolineales bacterium]